MTTLFHCVKFDCFKLVPRYCLATISIGLLYQRKHPTLILCYPVLIQWDPKIWNIIGLDIAGYEIIRKYYEKTVRVILGIELEEQYCSSVEFPYIRVSMWIWPHIGSSINSLDDDDVQICGVPWRNDARCSRATELEQNIIILLGLGVKRVKGRSLTLMVTLVIIRGRRRGTKRGSAWSYERVCTWVWCVMCGR